MVVPDSGRAARFVLAMALVAAIGAPFAAGCRSSHSDTTSDSAPPPDVTLPDGGAPVRAEFGLDGRPSNTTCTAFARPGPAAPVKLERVFPDVQLTGLMMLAQRPNDPSRWYAAQRTGEIFSFAADGSSPATTMVANVAALAGKPVSTEFEGGFLGMAFHPSFAADGRLFVSFTTTGPSGYAEEIGALKSTDHGATFTSYTTVFRYERQALYHCGGGITFGRDGYLYFSFGDGANDTNGQNTNVPFAKVHRIDVDDVPAGATYGIPTDNPFRSGGGFPTTFAWGFRNPFRLSVDRVTGDVWLGDVGEASFDEVNKVEIGKNYGWGCREGNAPYAATTPTKCPSTKGLVDPVIALEHAPPNSRSVTGGIVYRGAAMPEFQGTYVFGDFMHLEVYAMTTDPASGEVKWPVINTEGPRIAVTDFAEDVDGEIYASSVLDSKIYKLVPSGLSRPSTVPTKLSKTGCVDAADPTQPASGLVPYGVNVPLWSDGAEKGRWFALPDGKTIDVRDDGDFVFPVGSVLLKSFAIARSLVETRLLVRHDDGEWAGYSYEWDADGKDATLLTTGKSKTVGSQTWSYPSRTDCLRCHTEAAGRTLGPEVDQLNGDFVYEQTHRIANQLTTLEKIGVLSKPIGPVAASIQPLVPISGDAPTEATVRSYLHANCSHCHRPSGGAGQAQMDLRFSTPLSATNTCGVASGFDDLGVSGSKIVVPGHPESSILSLRVHATNAKRMPPMGTAMVDRTAVTAIDGWIAAMASCPGGM